MSNSDIIRILKRHFGYTIDETVLEDFDLFMEQYGNAISMEIMFLIFDAMQEAKKENDGCQQFRFEVTVEKSKQFKTIVGEYIG